MKTMTTMFILACGSSAFAAEVPIDSTISYQGRLTDGGDPATGQYDMRFSLYDAVAGGNQVGPTLAFDGNGGNPDPIGVTDGLFSAGLTFGDSVFVGDALWLRIDVRLHANGEYVSLDPRQPLTAVPYALYALDGPGGAGGAWALSGTDIHNTNSGNVGIGTSTPRTTLDVFGEDAVVRVESIRNDFGPKLVFRNRSTGGGISRGTIQFQDANNTLAEIKYRRPATGLAALSLGTAGGGLSILDGGQVGIGIADPDYKLSVNGRARLRQGGSNSAGIWFWQETPASDRAFVGMRTDDQVGFFSRDGAGWGFVMDTLSGNVGIGTTNSAAKLAVVKTTDDTQFAVNVINSSTGGGAGFFSTTDRSNTSPALFCFSNSSAPAFKTAGDAVINGTATVDILEIVGADLAEKFPVSDKPQPGMVVEIDPDHTGTLRIARGGAYNSRVAGVVSGANDFSVGAVLGHRPGDEDAPPIALSGRVWVYCDASTGAIEPGDLLTTSDTPGHAMKATDRARAYGATIGKAMSSLKEGRGMVLVLVSLQ